MAYKFKIQRAYYKIKHTTIVRGEDSCMNDEIKAISFIWIEELGKIFYLRDKNYQRLTGHKEVTKLIETNKAVWYDESANKLYTIKELHEMLLESCTDKKQKPIAYLVGKDG